MERINLDVLDGVLDRYQAHLDVTRRNESYKWRAIKHFKETYDPSADDLPAMLRNAFQVDHNPKLNLIFGGGTWNPVGMLEMFVRFDRQGTLDALDALFDESENLKPRMVAFEAWAIDILGRMNEQTVSRGKSPAKNHFQDPRAMSVYVTFMRPELHYLYKSTMYRDAAKFLGVGWPGNKFDKVITYREMCEQILTYLKEARPEVIEESDATLGDLTAYDPEHHMLVQDIVFYITEYDKDYRGTSGGGEISADDEWFPSADEYDPGIDADRWEELLGNPEVFTESALEIVSRMRDCGGSATCTQLAQKYGETKNFYNSGSVSLAKRVAEATKCPLPNDEENSRWWPILYVGKHADKGEAGSYVWKLRSELAQALERVDLARLKLNATVEEEPGKQPGSARVEFESTDEESPDIEEQFFRWNIEVNGRKEGYARANQRTLAKRSFADTMDECLPQYESAFQCTDYHEIEVAYDRALASPRNTEEHSHVSAALRNYLKFLKWRGGNDTREIEVEVSVVDRLEPYAEEDFLFDVYVTKEDLDDMKALLGRKRNLILQGSPGTGKTYCARRLAWAVMGYRDDSRITFVQFHQSTTYDDFVCGYRPDGNGGFAVKDGPFVRACREASRDPGRPHFVIIDEINRANISKVLGELLMLIEADHRGESVLLTVSNRELAVPENLYIIGMMNTADRGLALIDYALRRRFAFFEMEPALKHPRFLEQLGKSDDPRMAALVEATREVNKDIAGDAALGEGFRIGHSYFCGAKDARLVLRYELAPLVREYWFDDRKKMQQELDKLGQAVK